MTHAHLAAPNRIPAMLWAQAALQGAAVLVIEVLGARILTPYFGTSHYVWAAQITVTLVALAAGYALGARSSGAGPTRWLRTALSCSALWCALTPLVAPTVAYVSFRLPLPLAALGTSCVLFAAPLAALASMSPVLVGAAVAFDPNAGRTAGRMSAASTAGSVVGVLLVAYVGIPYLPTSYSMYGLAALLLGAALWPDRGYTLPGPVRLLTVLACAAAAFGVWRELAAPRTRTRLYDEVARTHSPYATAQVWRARGGTELALSTDFTFQNDYDPIAKRSTDAFSYVLNALARYYNPRAKEALVVGLGIGVVPRALSDWGVHSHVFELDPVVPELAARYFDFDPQSVTLTIGDGRSLLATNTQRFDLLILDAFRGDSTPSHLLSEEAFVSMARALTPDGVLLSNMWTDVTEQDQLMPVVLRTLRRVFAHVRVFDARLGNYYVAASNARELSPPTGIDTTHVPAPVLQQVTDTLRASRDVSASAGLTLRDAYNPADTLAAQYYEAVRRASAGLARPQ